MDQNDGKTPVLLYLDHNVIDRMTKSTVTINLNIPGARLAFSSESLEEVHRSGNAEHLKTLKGVDAVVLEFHQDHRLFWYAVNIDVYYEEWLSSRAIYSPVRDYFLEVSARHHGVRDLDSLSDTRRKLESQLNGLFQVADLPDELCGQVSEMIAGTDSLISQGYPTSDNPIQALRESLSVDRGAIGNVEGDNAIARIWDLILFHNPGLSELSAEAFFGFEHALCESKDSDRYLFLGIINAYVVLNLIGYRPDRQIKKERRFLASISDANHVAYGAFCQFFVTGDLLLAQKAYAIYEFKKLPVKIILL